jgi:hypothetical protein
MLRVDMASTAGSGDRVDCVAGGPMPTANMTTITVNEDEVSSESPAAPATHGESLSTRCGDLI